MIIEIINEVKYLKSILKPRINRIIILLTFIISEV